MAQHTHHKGSCGCSGPSKAIKAEKPDFTLALNQVTPTSTDSTAQVGVSDKNSGHTCCGGSDHKPDTATSHKGCCDGE